MIGQISQELADYFQSGISIVVGTCDARLRPDCVRAFSARAMAGSDEVEIVVPLATGAGNFANLADNGRIAVIFARAADHRSIQIKGTLVGRRDAGDEERRRGARYLDELSRDWAPVGIPPTLTRSLTRWPAAVLTIRVEEIFDQTPGPNAGRALAAAGAEG